MATETLFHPDHLYRLLQGLGVTLHIAILAMLFTLIFGTLFGVIMSRAHGGIKALCRLYLEALRLIPILVWLFVFYFGLAGVLHIHGTPVFLVNLGDDPTAAQEFLEQIEVSDLPQIQLEGEVPSELGITGFPATFIFQNGALRYRTQGALKAADEKALLSYAACFSPS